GPWEVLGRFIERWNPLRLEPIEIEDRDDLKRVAVKGVLEGAVQPIRGRDRGRPVTFQNMYNQIHAPEQVIARGDSRWDDGHLSFQNEDSHGLWSRFSWRVAEEAAGGGRRG